MYNHEFAPMRWLLKFDIEGRDVNALGLPSPTGTGLGLEILRKLGSARYAVGILPVPEVEPQHQHKQTRRQHLDAGRSQLSQLRDETRTDFCASLPSITSVPSAELYPD